MASLYAQLKLEENMKIAIYYDAVNNAIDNSTQWHTMSHLGDSLQKMHEVVHIKKDEDNIKSTIGTILKQKYDLLLTYNKTGANLLDLDGNHLLPKLEKPQLSWLTEHPVTFYNEYKKSDSLLRHYILTSKQHNFFTKKMGLKGSTSELLFGSAVQSNLISFKKRPFDVCIALQWRGLPDTNNFWKNLSAKEQEFFQTVNELQKFELNGDIFTAFYVVAEKYGLPLGSLEKYSHHIKALYWYARKTERIQLVKNLADSNLKILLIGGEEWKSILPTSNLNNITIVNPCNTRLLMDYYKKSKAVISTNCYNGANERTFDAMSCGAISISEDSPTLKNYFTDSKDILFYPRLDITKIMQELTDIINDDYQGGMIAESGLNNFLENHTWDHRAITLNEKIQSIKNKQLDISIKTTHQENTTQSKQNNSNEIILYQAYLNNEQLASLNPICTPHNASQNTAPEKREYQLFKNIFNKEKNKDVKWGLISSRFSSKTLVSENEFYAFCKDSLANGYDCAFINPMIGNEALFINVWEQGINNHKGMSAIAKFLQNECALNISEYHNSEKFAFCNYFVGNNLFWSNYIKFVDDIVNAIEKKCKKDPELNEVWSGSAKYKKDYTATMKPFVIERLFSLFIASNTSLKVISYQYKQEQYTDKFGKHLGDTLYELHKLKKMNTSNTSNELNIWKNLRQKLVQSGLLSAVYNLDDFNFTIPENIKRNIYNDDK